MSKREDTPTKRFAKRSLGQNFLVDGNYIKKITGELGEIADNLVIEIGPGRGALTDQIAGRAGHLIAIELDRELARILKNRFEGHENVEVREADILAVDLKSLVGGRGKAKLIANLPYNISTPFLQRLTESNDVISEAVLMLQREVVARVTAEPGNRERGFITVYLEAFFSAVKLFDVPPQVFRPVPKVWSSVLRLEPRSDVKINDIPLFRMVVSDGFRQKRKTILNNLKSADGTISWKEILSEAGVPEKLRPEDLTLAHWICLADAVNRHPGETGGGTRYAAGW